MKNNTNVLVYKYNGKLHYQWEASIIEYTENYIVVYGTPERKLIHHTKGKIFDCNTYSIEYYPLRKWFTVNIDIDEDGNHEYYCNICIPPKIIKGNICFTDLDIDVIRNKKGFWTIVDEDEFEENSIKMCYPTYIIENSKRSLNDLLFKIKEERYPFNGFFEKYINELGKGGIN
ncbi:DUF402 domain-containing protein [Pseudogracilibacillus auburnensis]|uniref:DUF402 domain-containing protein n=1 Tax=Pseudogracilibacillus auburnensis TaxID=1494959 RepID=A0A2V3VUA4_9BACI|nr:DUF402 domain-containing protein [Pseudogracilibacillus auburnensis]PXW85250.1 hypothetical protein DFR56_11116 [Pseudogracilibacillus auburnensis]